MKDRHINTDADIALQKKIYDEVKKELKINSFRFSLTILIKLVFYLSLTFTFYYLILKADNQLVFIFSYIFYGITLLLLTFNFAHDLSHNTVFKNDSLNNFGFTVIFALAGGHAQGWKKRHNLSHHFAPNVKGYDSDLSITKLMRVIPNSDYLWFHKYQHIYAPLAYTSYSIFWIFIKDFIILYSADEYKTKKNFSYHLFFWLQKFAYITIALIIPITFSQQHWPLVVIAFILMHLIQSMLLLFTFFMTHHVLNTDYPETNSEGLIKTSWFMNQVKSSNDMHPFSKTANFILGGFNNHIAHHLFPNIHHVHYPEINKTIYRILRENNIEPNQTTYWGGIISHLKHLKSMGVEPRYNTAPGV